MISQDRYCTDCTDMQASKFNIVCKRRVGLIRGLMLLLCSSSPKDFPPEPQCNVSMAPVRGAVCPSKKEG